MQIIESVNEMQSHAVRLRSQGKLLALVATKGYLHAGHGSLIELARSEADVVVVSTFVNPKQFGPNEDFDRYPRDPEHDRRFCEEHEVDILFRPRVAEMYPASFSTYVDEDGLSRGLCGVSRDHYFRGACTAHVKLFNIVRPDLTVFGQRDAQLSAVVRRVVEDLNFPVEVKVQPTVRDEDGLALNARNVYLNEFQRSDARTIFRSLQKGKELSDSGIRNVDRVLAEVTHHLSQVRRLRVIYVSAVDMETMEPVREIQPGRTLVAVAVWCDEVRLIDNILL